MSMGTLVRREFLSAVESHLPAAYVTSQVG